MDYPYEQLDPERFQTLCQSLLAAEHKNVQCFPVAQRDGGRDAVAIVESDTEREFILFQVKFVRLPGTLSDARAWLLAVLKAEKPKIEEQARRGAKLFVLMSNVPGTAQEDAGSIDKAQELLDGLPIPAMCWWRDDVNRRLDNAFNLKWIYPELMTGPDLLHALVECGLSENKSRRTAAIRAFTADQYDRDSQVKFKQVELQNGLLDLFIDVPVSLPRGEVSRENHAELSVLYHTSTSGARGQTSGVFEAYTMHDDSSVYYGQSPFDASMGASALLLSQAGQRLLPNIVLEGAPGQGKSTITQFICQVHRMRLLGLDDVSRLPQHIKLCPVRVPIRIDLRDLAAWLEKVNPFNASDSAEVPATWHRSLESFLAAHISYYSGGIEFTVADLLPVISLSAVLLVFDGLDEVAQTSRRQQVVDEIADGVRRLTSNASSLQVIVTSRPAAFANSPGLASNAFPYLELCSLTRPLINEYTEKWLKARSLSPADADTVRRILSEKLDAPHLRDLARNPMQLAILLSLVHTRGASLPDKRTALYDSYVELFFNREAEKSAIVREQRYLLIAVHRFLAWTLHVQAESRGGVGSIRADELEALLRQYLDQEGHDTALVTDLFTGIVERVVAIVSRVEGTFEFEVQPLREYFAARFLYETAPYSPPGAEKRGTKPERFAAIARNFYWLNVARFYAGCYSDGELQSLIEGLEELSLSESYKFVTHPRVLAGMLLSDWVFTQRPKAVQKVVSLITDEIGLQLVLAWDRLSAGRTSSFVFPKRCGRDELLEHAMDILVRKPAPDFAYLVADLIRQNVGAPDVKERWMNTIGECAQEERMLWLDHGARMGILSTLDYSELDELVASTGDHIPQSFMRLLRRDGQAEWLAADEERANAAVDDILDHGCMFSFSEHERHLLDHFCGALAPNVISINPASRDGRLDERIRAAGYYVPRSLATSHEREWPVLAACRRVLITAQQQWQRPVLEWETSLAPWNTIVEEARRVWGDRIALCHYANVAAGIRSRGEKCTDTPTLFDEGSPLCRRVRYGRLRSSDVGWWKTQLEHIEHPVQAMLACEVLLTWGSASTLLELAPQIDEILKALPLHEWRETHDGARVSLSPGTRVPRAARSEKLNIMHLAPGLSERTLVAIGLRCDQLSRDELFASRLWTYDGDDSEVLAFCMRYALDGVLSGREDWQKRLSIVARCYAHGTWGHWFTIFQAQRRMERGQSSRAHLRELAAIILGDPGSYPIFLLGLASYSVRDDIGRQLESVGSVADSEQWFES